MKTQKTLMLLLSTLFLTFLAMDASAASKKPGAAAKYLAANTGGATDEVTTALNNLAAPFTEAASDAAAASSGSRPLRITVTGRRGGHGRGRGRRPGTPTPGSAPSQHLETLSPMSGTPRRGRNPQVESPTLRRVKSDSAAYANEVTTRTEDLSPKTLKRLKAEAAQQRAAAASAAASASGKKKKKKKG